MDYRSTIEAVPDGTNDSFEPLAFHAEKSNNDTLHFGQAMKVNDSAGYTKAMKKKSNDLHEEKSHEIILMPKTPKDTKLMHFMLIVK